MTSKIAKKPFFLFLPLHFLLDVFKVIYFDLKDDAVWFVKAAKTGMRNEDDNESDIKVSDEMKRELSTGWGEYFKKNWHTLILFAAFGLVGYWVASQRYEALANEFIIRNCAQNLSETVEAFAKVNFNT